MLAGGLTAIGQGEGVAARGEGDGLDFIGGLPLPGEEGGVELVGHDLDQPVFEGCVDADDGLAGQFAAVAFDDLDGFAFGRHQTISLKVGAVVASG